jgi:3-oxoadipate enol-lactonase
VADEFIATSGGRLAYDQQGQGEAVVLLHAGIADRRMWDPQVAVLAERYRVVRHDFRSFGASPEGDQPIYHYRDLFGLLEALQIDCAALIGASLGAAVAVDFTLAHPARVSALVLVGPALGGYDLTPAFKRHGGGLRAAFASNDEAAIIEEHLRLWVDGIGRKPEQVNPTVRERMRELVGRTIDAQDGEPLDPPAIARLGEIRVPTLVVAGDEDLPESKETADILARGIPGARKVIIANAAHVPNMEQPDEFNRIVIDFLVSGLDKR